MDEDLDKKFKALVSQIEDVSITEHSISMGQLNETIMSLTETAMLVSRLIDTALSAPPEEQTEISEVVVLKIPELVAICAIISEEIHNSICEDCLLEEEIEDEDG